MIYVCIPTTSDRRKRLDECISAIRKNAGIPNYSIVVYENQKEGCQVAVRKMISGLGDSLCLILNDDMIAENNFLKNSVEAYMNEFPNMDGLGSLNDKKKYKEIAIVQLAPASLLYNYIYKGYFHYGGDNELADIFKAKNRYLTIDNAIINHVHPKYDNRPELMDATYINSRDVAKKKDGQLYEDRKKNSNNFTDLNKIDMNVIDYIGKR